MYNETAQKKGDCRSCPMNTGKDCEIDGNCSDEATEQEYYRAYPSLY